MQRCIQLRRSKPWLRLLIALGVRGALAPGMTAHQRCLTGQSPRHKLGSEVGAKQTLKWPGKRERGKEKPGGRVLVMTLLGSFWHQMVTSEALSLLGGQNPKKIIFPALVQRCHHWCEQLPTPTVYFFHASILWSASCTLLCRFIVYKAQYSRFCYYSHCIDEKTEV